MAKKLPAKLFVKIGEEGTRYFAADTTAEPLVEMGETVAIGEYRLVETKSATGVAQFKGRRK
jgi:hypothetical protein